MSTSKLIRFICITGLLILISGCGSDVECKNVNTQNKDGRSQLHSATFSRNYDIVECLLDNGAYINMVDKDGRTALHNAATRSDNLKVVKLLLKHGAFTHITDALGEALIDTAKNTARATNNWDMVMFLEKH